MNTFSRFVAAVGFVTTCGAASANVVFDATAEFSAKHNPAPAPDVAAVSGEFYFYWHYGYSVGNGAYTFNLFDGRNPLRNGWISSTYGSYDAPAAWQNTTGSVLNGVAPGQLSLHPGPDLFSAAVLRFVAPVSGAYSYWVQFLDGDYGETSGSVFVNGNRSDPLASFAKTSSGPSTGGSMLLNAGDSFDVAISNSGEFFFCNTPVQVIINLDSSSGGLPVRPVPEPQTLLMFVAGLVALGGLTRRRGARV